LKNGITIVSFISLLQFLLDLQITFDRALFPLVRAINSDLAKHQRELTHGIDGFDVGLCKQPTITSVEHTPEETSQETGETSTSAETGKGTRGDEPLVETFFEVLPVVRQGNREKRQPLVFKATQSCFAVLSGACVTSAPEFIESNLPDQHQAFHRSLSGVESLAVMFAVQSCTQQNS
jgi:hypothetical protein